ncbi:uncharacterized protein LOC109533306 [Dendroctonus ponderosae]|nr:uncharacterized protein LOC109533306 [Dendroctonus ponderosae]
MASDGDVPETGAQIYKIQCTHYPEIFELDKSVCKEYFRQFGKVLRVIFKPRQRAIVVQYVNKNDYFNALAGPSEYEGHPFKLEPFESPVTIPAPSESDSGPMKRSREKIVRAHKLIYRNPRMQTSNTQRVSYVDKEELNEELVAMAGYSNVKESIDLTSEDVAPHRKPKLIPKLNRVWKKSDQVTTTVPADKSNKLKLLKKKSKPKTITLTAEQLDLLKIIRSQATTIDEKYKLLDARDKFFRSNMKKSNLNYTPTLGTCPDMCPEKERLLREIQHQVSMYEQDGTNRHSMSQVKAVKQYSRSSADQESPLAHELRPVSVLQMTMVYLMYNIMDLVEDESDVNIGEWFHFLWDRTRGIRKDITQQALCSQGSVELVEQCARFHIHCSARFMGEDPSVFDQKINTENLTKCLQTLKYMYHDLELKGEMCPNEPEFRAYIILLNICDGNFMWEVQNLRTDIQKSPEVKFALQVYSAFEKRHFVKFFKLIRSTTYLNACILMRYFVQVRLQAIESLIKCFTPPKSISFYPVPEIAYLLLFDDFESTVDFMKTFGIGMNKNNTNFMIDRSTFCIPEYPYVLERSKCVESKRSLSVGAVVNGREISPELYMEVQSHEVYNSFDKDGYLIQDELFNDIELGIEERLLDDVDSRESTPERKSIVTNIFAPTVQSNITTRKAPRSVPTAPNDANIFAQSKSEALPFKSENSNIFAVKKTDSIDIFNQAKTEPSNIFSEIKRESTQIQQDKINNIFGADKMDSTDGFKPKNELSSAPNIFAPVFKSGARNESNVFSQQPKEDNVFLNKSHNENVFNKPNTLFTEHYRADPRTQPKAPNLTETFASSQPKNIFGGSNQEHPTAFPSKGGFTFELNRPLKSDVINPTIVQHTDKVIDGELNIDTDTKVSAEELLKIEMEKKRQEQKKAQEELEKRYKEEQQAERKRQEQIEKQRQLEQQRIDKKKRLEEDRVRREKQVEQERKQKVEQLKKLQNEIKEKQKREQEEKERNLEIQKTVKSVVNKMVETVDLKLRQETLKKIKTNIKRRYLISICKKWRNIANRKMKRRKALDCNPIFVHSKSVAECAKDLHSSSQELALSNIKRYKSGQASPILLTRKQPIGQLKLFNLTYSSLRRRLCELKEKWHQRIYWKVVISLPGIDEMLTGLNKLEETLKAYVNWQLDKYGNTIYIENHKTVTYCVEKQQGLDVNSSDANGFVFIAKNFNDIMQRRVFQILKNVGVYVNLPIVLILEDTTNSEEYLRNLKKTGVVSDFVIYSWNTSLQVLPSIIDNGFIFLSKRVQKMPPLELDTFHDFLTRHLCTEMWKKAASYAKWNHEYHFCMRDPNIVIGLYNEGLERLSRIITDANNKEHPIFPEIFREYLPCKIPPFLPCDYRYFPSFWTSPTYEKQLKSILANLQLPKFIEKWPPENDTDLLVSISKYCTEVFKNPKDPLVRLLHILKASAEEFGFEKVTWTEAIQVIARKKLDEQTFKLPPEMESDNFETLIVVYDVNGLSEFSSTEWFYRNNPVVEGFKKIIAGKLEDETNMKRSALKRRHSIDEMIDQDELLRIMDKAEKMLRSPKNFRADTKIQIEALNRSLQDLEDSINVVKIMDDRNLLHKFLEQ